MSLLEEIIDASKPTRVPKGLAKTPFVEGFWPWVSLCCHHLKRRAGHLFSPLSSGAILALEQALLTRLVHVAAPSFALELSVARLQGSLRGKNGRERYRDFLRKTFWDRQRLSAFFEEYSEVARVVALLMEMWVAQAVEFLERLSNDLPLLEKTYNQGRSLGKILFLSCYEGDTHQEGRSVYRLKFASGKELFYKPKDLSFTATFHSLFDQLNAWGVTPDLKGYTVVPRNGYGWEEKVAQAPCQSREEVMLYFERAGMLLALLYLFDGVDAHYENLIARGEYPTLIDHETFFHRELFFPNKPEDEGMAAHSVLATTLLPVFVEKPDGVRIDVGGLSGKSSTISVGEWRDVGTDKIQFVYEKKIVSRTSHQVFLDGTVEEPHLYVREIIRGFRKIYSCIQKNRSYFLKKGGWLDLAASSPMRVVLRPTRLYSYLLERFTSPTISLHESERAKELSILSRYWIEPGREHLCAIIEEEKRALQRRDVPIFHAFPKKRDLYAGDRLVLKGSLDGDAYQRASGRLRAMGKEDCTLQETFIHLSFYGKETAMHAGETRRDFAGFEAKKLAPQDLIREALVIGQTILKRAYPSKNGALGWIALEPKPEFERCELQPLTDALYGGKMGVALFFAALHFITKEKKWRKAALDALKNLRGEIAQGKAARLPVVLGSEA